MVKFFEKGMTRAEYIQYRTTGNLVPIFWGYYTKYFESFSNEKLDPKPVFIPFELFAQALPAYLQAGGTVTKVFQYYNDKFDLMETSVTKDGKQLHRIIQDE